MLPQSLQFSSVKRRKVEADFSGGDITSNAGIVLLSEVDRKIGLSRSVARAIDDDRRKASCEHSVEALLKQRIYALALGYEDLNDHKELRYDLALQTAVSRDKPLASAATLSRFESRANRDSAIAIHQVLFDQFIKAYNKPPKRLILDFDATDTPLHGEQEGRFFHGYYDHYCYLPLYVFCDRHLLISYLRPSNIDGAKHSWAILSLLVKAIRAHWPRTEIIFRGDSGFCRWKMLRWCDRHKVGYIVGLAKNKRLTEYSGYWIEMAESLFRVTGKKQRLFTSIRYSAKTWDKRRRVIVKAEHTRLGGNPRYVVTNLDQNDRYLYDKIYCARGDMENRIKDQQLGLFARRTSSHRWWNNQFRQLLSGLAYVLLEAMRYRLLKNTKLEKSAPNTLRLVLLKIGAVIIRNTRRIKMMMSSAYPHQDTLTAILSRLNTS
ncbi:MAG: IS1380 family transposase [Cohaesibacter sp.]|nr:IS1380 family transposase [Cohaesibacter sp.]MCV6589896.1 IS1380 family transposase [Marinobacterium sp.]